MTFGADADDALRRHIGDDLAPVDNALCRHMHSLTTHCPLTTHYPLTMHHPLQDDAL